MKARPVSISAYTVVVSASTESAQVSKGTGRHEVKLLSKRPRIVPNSEEIHGETRRNTAMSKTAREQPLPILQAKQISLECICTLVALYAQRPKPIVRRTFYSHIPDVYVVVKLFQTLSFSIGAQKYVLNSFLQPNPYTYMKICFLCG